MTEENAMVGLRRFHSMTILAGIIFLAILGFRFYLSWQEFGGIRGFFALLTIVADAALIVHWLRFRKTGI